MTVQDICYDRKDKDIPETMIIQDTCYDRRDKGVPGTMTVQDTCSDEGARTKTSRSPLTATKLETRDTTREDAKDLHRKISQITAHESRFQPRSADTVPNQGDSSKLMRFVGQAGNGRFQTVSEEPIPSTRSEWRGEDISCTWQNEEAFTEQVLLSPGLKWMGSGIYDAPVHDLVGEERNEEELISIHSLDVFVCPRCEREFDTGEERRYVEHCQKCLDYG